MAISERSLMQKPKSSLRNWVNKQSWLFWYWNKFTLGLIHISFKCKTFLFVKNFVKLLKTRILWNFSKFQNRNRKTSCLYDLSDLHHGLQMPGEEISFTAWLKNKSQSQIFRYGQSIFCLTHFPKFQISLIYAFIGCP